MNFQELLHNTLIRSTSENNAQATAQFDQWEKENEAAFLFELATYLGDESKPDGARFMAGILLKNSFSAENIQLHEQRQNRWLKVLPDEVKVHIRKNAYQAMASESPNARKSAAQVIGKIGTLDLNGEWPDLMKMLMDISVDETKSVNHKLACIDSIGYICEESENLESFSDTVLTSIIANMKDLEHPPVVISSLNALSSALEFCQKNFESPNERTLIVDSLVNCCRKGNSDVSETSFGVIISMVSHFYEHMQDQMPKLFNVTLEAINNADDDIAKYATEFWNTICEIEMDLKLEGEHCFNFSNQALGDMVPTLFKTLTKQDDPEYDSDDFTLPISASVSLKFFAQSVQEEIIPHLMPFVEEHINSNQWNLQDAAILALVAILEVPSQKISDIVKTAIPILLNLLQTSPVIAIRDNSAWTLGQIFKQHPEASFPFADAVFAYMGNALTSESARIASHACWTIHSMAESFGCHAGSPIIKNYKILLETLLKTGDRSDAVDYNLRSSAYETLVVLLLLAPEGSESVFLELLNAVVGRLESTITNNPDQALAEAAELCCGVIQVIISELGQTLSEEIIDRIMGALLGLLNSANGKQVSHDVFLAITFIEQAIYENFMKYIPDTMPFVMSGLKNWEDSNACTSATDLLSDLTNILGDAVTKYSDDCMNALLENMKQDELHRSVKPATIRCFGDMSMSLGFQFSTYSFHVLEVLHDTSSILTGLNFDDLDYEDSDYVDSIRTALFDTYASIVTSASQKEKELLKESCKMLMDLIYVTAQQQEDRQSDLICATWGLLGDLIALFGSSMKEIVHPQLQELAYTCSKKSENDMEKEVADRALASLRTLRL